jgi:hypothetical protein
MTRTALPPMPKKPRKLSLIHRGYLYAQKHIRQRSRSVFEPDPGPPTSEQRMTVARAWREGYMSAQRDARKNHS